MDFKDKIEAIKKVKGMPKNFKEWYDDQQPKKRCDMIEGHDNYWEGRIEAIKKVLDDTPARTASDFEKALNEIKKILEESRKVFRLRMLRYQLTKINHLPLTKLTKRNFLTKLYKIYIK